MTPEEIWDDACKTTLQELSSQFLMGMESYPDLYRSVMKLVAESILKFPLPPVPKYI